MGEPGKIWVKEPGTEGRRWLFKPVRLQSDVYGEFPQGHDWAERIAAELAKLIGLPAAHVELARRANTVGAVSLDIAGTRLGLSPGNEVLAGQDPDYPAHQVGTVAEYTLDRIFTAMELGKVRAHWDLDTEGHYARSQFVGYLVLDAWVANQDRHHGNWGILQDLITGGRPVLAPSFDHGSSLGFQIRDQAKLDMLERGQIRRWARRGHCRPMAGRPNLVELAHEAVRQTRPTGELWLSRLANISDEQEESVIAAVPDARMSHASRMFAVALLGTNRRRLLDGP